MLSRQVKLQTIALYYIIYRPRDTKGKNLGKSIESNGRRRISSHCITVSSNQYQKYKCLSGTAGTQTILGSCKERTIVFFVQLGFVSAWLDEAVKLLPATKTKNSVSMLTNRSLLSSTWFLALNSK